MIGEILPDSDNEFQEILRRQKRLNAFTEELMAELKGIQPGQCLRYGIPKVSNPFLSLSLSVMAASIKGLKVITEGEYSYVYREK